jgi:copper chaperone CopZ
MRIRKNALLTLLVFIILGFLGLAFYSSLEGKEDSLSKAVFFVSWYDVGKAALEGLPGVKKVKRGFQEGKEINTVYYDPARITIREMEAALKRAGTYQGTEHWISSRGSHLDQASRFPIRRRGEGASGAHPESQTIHPVSSHAGRPRRLPPIVQSGDMGDTGKWKHMGINDLG